MPGSSGCLLPSNQGRLIDQDGNEITSYDTAGELYLKSAAMIPGYLGEDDAMRAKFTVDGWLPTGDIGFFRRSPHGDDHLYLVDRLKDMIKVKVSSSFILTCHSLKVSRVYKSTPLRSRNYSVYSLVFWTQQSLAL
jgi:acyl-CoA synthetase (AMP-forming)/AMP-acid ligase II